MFFSLSAAAIVGGLFGLIWAAYGIFVFVLAIMGIDVYKRQVRMSRN